MKKLSERKREMKEEDEGGNRRIKEVKEKNREREEHWRKFF